MGQAKRRREARQHPVLEDYDGGCPEVSAHLGSRE